MTLRCGECKSSNLTYSVLEVGRHSIGLSGYEHKCAHFESEPARIENDHFKVTMIIVCWSCGSELARFNIEKPISEVKIVDIKPPSKITMEIINDFQKITSNSYLTKDDILSDYVFGNKKLDCGNEGYIRGLSEGLDDPEFAKLQLQRIRKRVKKVEELQYIIRELRKELWDQREKYSEVTK